MKYPYIIFDLDGTLTDSALGITRSAAYALKKYGIIEDPKNLIAFVGPPLYESFMNYYNFSKEKAVEAVAYFREYFTEKGMYENEPYENIETTLKALKTVGYTLAVATSKPTVFAQKILSYFSLDGYFNLILGCELDGTRINKDEVISEVLLNISCDKTAAVMVGDRSQDILGAKANGLASVGALYGYGTKEELTKAGADYLISIPGELLRIV